MRRRRNESALPDVSWCRKGGARGDVTTQTVSWHLMWKGSPYVLDIPPGRAFESAVPRSLHWLWSPDDPFYLKAALIHDVLLESGARGFEADSQWRAAALSNKAPALRAGVAYFGMLMRRFGQWAFKTTSP